MINDKVNLDKIRQNRNRYNNINGIENKLTGFQIDPKTEFACKYKTPIYKTQYPETLVEYEKIFDMKIGKLKSNPYPMYHNKNDENSYIPVTFLKNSGGNTSGKLRPQGKGSTRLQELSLMNNTYFDAIHYDVHLDMKLDYAISRNFKKCHYQN